MPDTEGMADPLYTRNVMGYVEQLFNDEGHCIRQRFVPFEGENIERRVYRPTVPAEKCPEGELSHDELIEHPEDLAEIEAREKFQPYEMLQPKATKPQSKKK